MTLHIRPLTFRIACAFVENLHRHNKPPRGHKFSVGVFDAEGVLRGVAMVGRPIARHFDDGLCAEVNRTCTDGARNANSMLYGATARACKAMGYDRLVTYTRSDESGASLRAAGFVKVKELAARGSWAQCSLALRDIRDQDGDGGVDRVLWEIRFGGGGKWSRLKLRMRERWGSYMPRARRFGTAGAIRRI